MKIPRLALIVLLATLSNSMLPAQLAVPEPPPANAGQPPVVSIEAPLASLESQLGTAQFDQRGAFATAYDEANRLVDIQVAELRSRGLIFAEEATSNLTVAREETKQVFRDLSLTTSESWQSARHNAMLAVRKIQDALKDLEKSATKPQA